jgi:hypothetical protein
MELNAIAAPAVIGFRKVTEHLTAYSTVVLYDRRGFSGSHLTGPQDGTRRLGLLAARPGSARGAGRGHDSYAEMSAACVTAVCKGTTCATRPGLDQLRN